MQTWRPSRLPLPLPPALLYLTRISCPIFIALKVSVLLLVFLIYLFNFIYFLGFVQQVHRYLLFITIIIIQTRTFLEVKGGCYEITTADSRDEPSLNEGRSFTLCVRQKGNLFNCSWRIIASQWCDGSSVRPCEPALSTRVSPPTSPLPVVTEPRLRVPCVPHHTPSGDLFYVW